MILDDLRIEAYEYFDAQIRRLPRDKAGKIKLSGPELDDNDVDAFRHAYVSGVFTQEYGETVANIFGLLNEFDPAGSYSNSQVPLARDMDLWNNRVGRKYGKKTKGRKTLLKFIHKALKNGELVVDLKDKRTFSGPRKPPTRMAKPLIAISQTKTGRNELFFDLVTLKTYSREELVLLIRQGKYRAYSVKKIGGIETPVSRRDGKKINNIG